MSSITKRMDLSFINKAFILFSLIISFITLYYFVISTKTSTLNLLISKITEIPSNQCRLSLNQSDGWFCELDSDWKRRKNLHHLQDQRNRISDSRSLFFQNNWEPTIQCEFERRLGNTGDGGKWVCDIHRFQQIHNKTFLIYSFGSSGDFSFEKAIKNELTQGEIHTFDMGLYKCPDNLCIFHQTRLGDGKSDGSKSLQMIINELGHQKREIDILKVDIEGSEYILFEELFKSSSINNQTITVPYIRQILFEIHLGTGTTEEACKQTHHLFELFRANNYAIFHKEANLYDAQNVFEYALLRLNPVFFTLPL